MEPSAFLSTCVTTIYSARTGAAVIANPETSNSASPKVFSTRFLQMSVVGMPVELHVHAVRCVQLLRPSLLQGFEISQIRRRLIFADGHQHPVTAHVIAFSADSDHRVVHAFGTVSLAPARTRIRAVY